MPEHLRQPRDARVAVLFERIARLKVGKAITIGGTWDVAYLTREIEGLRVKDPSLASDLDDLIAELGTVDPSLSTWDVRRSRSPSGVGGGEIKWGDVDRSALQVLGISDGGSKKSAGITEEAAQAVVDEGRLDDGIYTLKRTRGEVYIIVRDGKVSAQVFEPPDYDIGYVMRCARDLKFKGVIQL